MNKTLKSALWGLLGLVAVVCFCNLVASPAARSSGLMLQVSFVPGVMLGFMIPFMLTMSYYVVKEQKGKRYTFFQHMTTGWKR